MVIQYCSEVPTVKTFLTIMAKQHSSCFDGSSGSDGGDGRCTELKRRFRRVFEHVYTGNLVRLKKEIRVRVWSRPPGPTIEPGVFVLKKILMLKMLETFTRY